MATHARLSTVVPLVVTLALLLAVVLGWAFGEPDYPPLGRGNLPQVDMPCAGSVITADARLRDPNFAGASIALCWHDATGALGVILNRPLDVHVRTLVAQAPLDAGRLSLGGPLEKAQGLVLYRRDGELRITTSALNAPFPTTGWARPSRVAWEEVLLVAQGYAGWAPDQLEAEVEDGAWTLSGVAPEAVLQRAR